MVRSQLSLIGQQGGKICLWTYCLPVGGFRKFLHIKFYFGFWDYKMLENVVFHRFLGNKTSTPLNLHQPNLSWKGRKIKILRGIPK